MSHSRTTHSNNHFVSLLAIFSKIKTLTIFALLLLEKPHSVFATVDIVVRPFDVTEQPTILTAFQNDDVDLFKTVYNPKEPFVHIDIRKILDPQDTLLGSEIERGYFDYACFDGKKAIAKFLFENRLFNERSLTIAILSSARENQVNLLKHVGFTKEQLTAAFCWMQDVFFQNTDISYSYVNSKKTLQILTTLGANINACYFSPLALAIFADEIDMIRLYFKYNADMYKVDKVDSENLIFPLEYTDLSSKHYVEIVTLFCENGYDIYRPAPQYGKDTINQILDRLLYSEARIIELIKQFAMRPATRELAHQLQISYEYRKQFGFKLYTHYSLIYEVFLDYWKSLLSLAAVTILIGKGIPYLRTKKSEYDQAKKNKDLKAKLDSKKNSQKTAEPSSKPIKKYTSMIYLNEEITKAIPETVINHEPIKVKPAKHVPIKSAAKIHAEEIAKALEQKRKEKELALLQDKEIERLAKEEALAKKNEWKHKREEEKEQRLKDALEQQHLKLAQEKDKKAISNDPSHSSSASSSKHTMHYEMKECVRAAVQHAANISVISAVEDDKHSEYFQLNSFINHLALIFNIHRYYLSMLTYMMASPKYRTSNEVILAKEMRNLMIHGESFQESKEVVLATAVLMKKFMPQDLSRLKEIHSQKQIVAENDITKLIELTGEGKLQVLFLTSMEETPLYKALSLKANQKLSNQFANCGNLYDEDNAYYYWVQHKIFPLINRIAQPILKNSRANAREYFGEPLDAIRMLLAMCGEYYNIDRKKRFHEAKIKNNLHQILSSCHVIRNDVAHYHGEFDDQKLLDICKDIARSSSSLCSLNHIDISIPTPAAGSSSSAGSSRLSLFAPLHPKNVDPQVSPSLTYNL